MNFAKKCLITYDALIHYVRKNRNFAFQAINSENDQKIGRKYNGNLPVTFKENSFVVAQGLVAFRCYIGVSFAFMRV